MSGFHGKNAQLLVADNLQAVSSGTMNNIAGTEVYQIVGSATSNQDWAFDPSNTALKFEIEQPKGSGNWSFVGAEHPGINYAAGAIYLPQYAGNCFVVARNVLRSNLSNVTMKMTQNKSWEVKFDQSTVDASVMGEYWGSQLPGLPAFSGSIKGLFLDGAKYEKAVVNASGVSLRRIVRFRPTNSLSTYYQGAVRFTNWGLSASLDGPIEENLDFVGDGPLDVLKNGSPFFTALF